MKWSKNVCDKE